MILNQKISTQLKISLFYLLFGFLLILFLNSFFKISIRENAYILLFLLITSLIFYFITFFFIERSKISNTIALSNLYELFDKIPLSICVFSEKEDILYTNQEFKKIMGYDDIKLKNKNLYDLLELTVEEKHNIKKTISVGLSFNGQVSFFRNDGSKGKEICCIVPVYNEFLKINEYLKISIDISEIEQKINNEEIEKEKLFFLNKAKTQFISNISQEIRTPMSGIIGMTELLQLTNLNKEQKEYLDIISFSSSTLLAILNDILDFSRIEAGKLKLEKVEFDIVNLIQKTSQILEFDAKRKNLSLKTNINSNINYKVIGDPLRVNQVIINCLKNSIKYSEKGIILFEVNEIHKTESKAILSFKISDSGIGIDKEKLNLLFGDLDKEGNIPMSKFNYSGIGLGISIIKYLIGLMNGKIKVQSEVGKGSTFIIEIPFEITPIITEKEKEITVTEKEVGKINVLVAEDNIVNQRLVKELLIRKNYDVTIVENGLKIFDALEQKQYDLILMDIQMPIMDGIEATAIIREIEKGTGKHIPIIGITAYSVKADKENCLNAGMDDYLAKPFVKEEFYRILEKHLKKSKD